MLGQLPELLATLGIYQKLRVDLGKVCVENMVVYLLEASQSGSMSPQIIGLDENSRAMRKLRQDSWRIPDKQLGVAQSPSLS